MYTLKKLFSCTSKYVCVCVCVCVKTQRQKQTLAWSILTIRPSVRAYLLRYETTLDSQRTYFLSTRIKRKEIVIECKSFATIWRKHFQLHKRRKVNINSKSAA